MFQLLFFCQTEIHDFSAGPSFLELYTRPPQAALG